MPPLEYGIRETTLRGYSEPFRDLNIERLPFNPLWGLTVVERSDVLNGLCRAFAHATPLTLPNTVLLLLQTVALSHLGAKMTQNETTPLRHAGTAYWSERMHGARTRSRRAAKQNGMERVCGTKIRYMVLCKWDTIKKESASDSTLKRF